MAPSASEERRGDKGAAGRAAPGLLHVCRWEEQRRVYTKPTFVSTTVRGASEAFLRQLNFGVTTVELRCAGCGNVREVLLTGKVGAEERI